MAERLEESSGLEATTVNINRTSTTVKGGRRLSFSALVVVGDRNGNVGLGYGKGRGVPAAIEKAQKDAKKELTPILRTGGTLPHPVTGKYLASKVRLIPAAPGTGVIAGGTVRAVLEAAGVRDCLTKAYGSTNKINLAKAAIVALKQLRTRESIAELRGIELKSSAVDEMLEASRRFISEAEAEHAAKAPKKAEPKGKKGDRGGKQGGVKGKGKKKAEEVATSQEQGSTDNARVGDGEPMASAAPSSPEHIEQDDNAAASVETSKNPPEDNLTLPQTADDPELDNGPAA